MFRRFPMMDKQSQIVQRYTTENHNIFRKQFEDTYRGFPMHFQRSTPLVDSQMCSTDFPNISFAQNQARARKIHPYAVGFAANTSSGRTVRTLRPLWRSICCLALQQHTPGASYTLSQEVSWLICCGNALQFALYLCHRLTPRVVAIFFIMRA